MSIFYGQYFVFLLFEMRKDPVDFVKEANYFTLPSQMVLRPTALAPTHADCENVFVLQAENILIRFIISSKKCIRTSRLKHQKREGDTIVRCTFRNQVFDAFTADASGLRHQPADGIKDQSMGLFDITGVAIVQGECRPLVFDDHTPLIIIRQQDG